MQKIAIYGAGGFGREIKLLIEQINEKKLTWEFVGFYDDDTNKQGDTILGDLKSLNEVSESLHVVIAIADGDIRKKLSEMIINPHVQFATLIHPSVVYSESEVNIGEGVIIGALSVLTTNIKLGNFVILNLNCTVGHDVKIGDFSSSMPGVNISGNVTIGTQTLIGTGSQLLQNIRIGSNCTIGAGAVVIYDVPDNTTAVGVPAKPINKSTNNHINK